MRINFSAKFITLIFGAATGLMTATMQLPQDAEEVARELATRTQQDTEALQRAHEFAHDQGRQEAEGRYQSSRDPFGAVDRRATQPAGPLFPQSIERGIGNSWSNQGLQQGLFSNRPSIRREDLEKLSEIERNLDMLVQNGPESKTDTDAYAFRQKVAAELGKQYDLYLDQHEKPLIELEARVAKLREDFEWRKKAKAKLVELRVDTIWYDSQGLGWPAQPQPLANYPNQNPFAQGAGGFLGRPPRHDNANTPATIPVDPSPPRGPSAVAPRPNR